jgi:hypothetical protein
MNFTYGNLEGPYFSPGRIKTLEELAGIIQERMGVSDFHLRYDPREDYHYLEFAYCGIQIGIRYYKVFAVLYDGVDAPGWFAMPWHVLLSDGLYHIKNHCRPKVWLQDLEDAVKLDRELAGLPGYGVNCLGSLITSFIYGFCYEGGQNHGHGSVHGGRSADTLLEVEGGDGS